MENIKGRFTGLIHVEDARLDGEFVSDVAPTPDPVPDPDPAPDPGPPTSPPKITGLDLSAASFKTPDDWESVYTSKWGPLGEQTQAQIDKLNNNTSGSAYDDASAYFAWHTHYWVKALVVMAGITQEAKYLDTCVSLIDYMLAHTDQRRAERGETITYTRDPSFFTGTGLGGPFWKQNKFAMVHVTGQISNCVMMFVDFVYTGNWPSYKSKADDYFTQVKTAIAAFDNNWQNFGDKGSYHYRREVGNYLGLTKTAFNQTATMLRAQLYVHRWEPSDDRAEKIRRHVNYWLEEYVTLNSDGTLVYNYIRSGGKPWPIEDADHGKMDLDFLIAAYDSGLTGLTEDHMKRFAKTFLTKVYDGNAGLNKYIDGTTENRYNKFWDAGLGWFDLARFDPSVADAVLTVFNTHYPADGSGQNLWGRPMLGWANLLRAAK